MALRWGIVTAGKISHDLVTCLNSLPKTEHQVVAVGARTLDRAKTFAAEHSIGKAYGSYEELSQDNDIDIAYVATLNFDHFWVSKMMLEAGKHVLCEKSLCTNLTQTEELIQIAKKHNRFLMEAIWSRCFPIYQHLRNELAEGTIGTPNMVQVTFLLSKNMHDLDHFLKRGSVVLDEGVYAVQLVSLVYGNEMPIKITASGYVSKGVDEVAVVSLHYSRERVANFSVSVRSEGWNCAVISGTHGFIKLEQPFHCPTEMVTSTKTYEETLPKVNGQMNYVNAEGLIYEVQHVRECIRKGLKESPLISLEESKVISHILTEVRKQLGVPNP